MCDKKLFKRKSVTTKNGARLRHVKTTLQKTATAPGENNT
ncbi:hypothetical protein LTSEINV_4024 [Salmonella enterica subsp. enterica serovar Inverness str. R8-3668]|uniref:Uncharacterized protein n=7 Tax=Salmonella enterica I TaxID=59201 RepID=A0A0N1QYF7_SALSV|nr:hypothetical protein SNSL254_A2854 [Salmonella enterica subsp. enterica serovar Newport str. SL254]ACF91559.1 hypothetical protein SeSA_A2836 [Salmonella enterica subsp. enterica serovar Schwarzengrund str. CVM19633]AGS30730.1 hypothetical protein SN31241_37570 [Salmonella enterica subsp. enterica serovar Newport str. USMARC-S3124.1]AJQ75119.1 hypothetical protein AW67_32090 [Salmonella enterica subsp. enterica serovar Montevideo str. USDA-ARS-USMARC-1903]EDX48269.1 hypothetical protein SNSL